MSLSLLILKSGETLISQSDELDYEPKVHLVEPYMVSGKTKITLTPWPSYTDDKHILLRSDDLLTVCEASKNVQDAYLKKIGKKIEDFTPKEPEQKPVLLNEDEGVPSSYEEYTPDHYEPEYLEDPFT